MVGDQLTCTNVRASRRWRQPEQNIKDRFTWAKEVAGTCTCTCTCACSLTHSCISCICAWHKIHFLHVYSIDLYASSSILGDFHFLWECLGVVFTMFWGSPAQPGSLCNLREFIRRTQVNKTAKVFNVGDEFLVHAFKAHLVAGILVKLNITSTSDKLSILLLRNGLKI